MQLQSLSRDLARFVFGLSFKQLPKEVVDRTKNLILDALSAAIAAHDSSHGKIALELVKEGKGNTTIFTSGLRVPVIDSTFVNAVLTTSIGQDDWASTYFAHPGSVVIPAAIAIAEQESSSGSEVITSVVAGYDIMARIFLGAPSIRPRFRSTTVIGPFGAAAAAGKLLKLNEEQLTHALGYASNFSSGFSECFATGFMERKFNDAMASRNGVTAALLAKAGAMASEKSLEGKFGFYQAFAGTTEGLDAATIDLGKRFWIMDATYKPYPASAEQQVNVHFALSLVKQHDIKGKDIDKVIVVVPDDGRMSAAGYADAGPFTSRLVAIASTPFNVAAALLGKPVTSYTFYDNYNDPEALELAQNIKLTGEKGRKTTKIEVTLHNGKQYSIEGSGAEILVPTNEGVVAKFNSLTSSFLGKDRADKIADIVLNLDKVDNIRQLTQELGKC